MCVTYRKSSIKPPGAYLILDPPEGGFNSQNQVTRIYLVAFQFFCPIFYGFDIQFNE